MDTLEERLRAEIGKASAALRSDLATQRAELIQAIAESRSDMMRWGITMIIALSSNFAVLDLFID